MKKLLLPMIALALLNGCAFLSTQQTDESPERTITTKVKATAFFSSAQTIEKLKATTTDRTQTVGTDGMTQHGATNTAATVDALGRLLQALKP